MYLLSDKNQARDSVLGAVLGGEIASHSWSWPGKQTPKAEWLSCFVKFIKAGRAVKMSRQRQSIVWSLRYVQLDLPLSMEKVCHGIENVINKLPNNLCQERAPERGCTGHDIRCAS